MISPAPHRVWGPTSDSSEQRLEVVANALEPETCVDTDWRDGEFDFIAETTLGGNSPF